MISTNVAGTAAANGQSSESTAGMTPDGRWITFRSEAGDLHPLDTDTVEDLYVFDRVMGEKILVSVSIDGTASGDQGSGDGSISADGRWVGFSSGSTNLVHNDTNGLWDAFVRDLEYGRTYLLSRNPAGDSGAGSRMPAFCRRIRTGFSSTARPPISSGGQQHGIRCLSLSGSALRRRLRVGGSFPVVGDPAVNTSLENQ